MTEIREPQAWNAPRLSDDDLKGVRPAAKQVHRIFIKATPEKIWDAITQPEWTRRYGYHGYVEVELRPGGRYLVRPNERLVSVGGDPVPAIILEGVVVEAQPPNRLVHTIRMLMDAETAKEPPSRITYEINDRGDGTCSLTVIHELEGSPRLAAVVSGDLEKLGAGGGHPWMLSDLKTLLETGRGLGE